MNIRSRARSWRSAMAVTSSRFEQTSDSTADIPCFEGEASGTSTFGFVAWLLIACSGTVAN